MIKEEKIYGGQIWRHIPNDKYMPAYVVVLNVNKHVANPNEHEIIYHGYHRDRERNIIPIPKRSVLTRDKFIEQFIHLPHKALDFINKVID